MTQKTTTYDLENDDLENNDLENDDLENDDLENDDLSLGRKRNFIRIQFSGCAEGELTFCTLDFEDGFHTLSGKKDARNGYLSRS